MEKAEQLFCGIVLNEKLENKGSASIAVDLGQEIINVFFESSVSCEIEIPERAIFKSGEIFYHDNKIQEFRLTVIIPAESGSAATLKTICITENEPQSQFNQIKNAAGIKDFFTDLDRKYSEPVSGKKKKFPVKPENIKYVKTIEAELQVAPADRTRKYLAACIEDNQLYFCWNLPRLENVDNPSEEFKSEPGLQPFVLKSLYPILGFIKISLIDLPNCLAISLKTLLSVHTPKRSIYQGNQKLESPGTILTYCYESSAIEQALYNAFEEIIDVPAAAIDRIINKNGYNLEQAIQVFFLEVIWARDEFYNQEVFLQYPRFVADMLEFTNSALTELYARNMALRFSPHSTISVKDRSAAISALGAELQKRINELFLFTAGRRQGSTNLPLPDEEAVEEKRLADQIRNAIKIVCQKMIKKHGPFEYESKVTRIAVADQLKVSTKTLRRRISVCGLDFNGERDKLLRHYLRT